jgi:hypothetical protein
VVFASVNCAFVRIVVSSEGDQVNDDKEGNASAAAVYQLIRGAEADPRLICEELQRGDESNASPSLLHEITNTYRMYVK